MPTRSLALSADDAVSSEYSGKWVAWTSDHSQIVASADRLSELWQQVRDQRIEDPVAVTPMSSLPRSGW